MKELFKKIFGLEPMNAADVEAVRELPVVVAVVLVAVVGVVFFG